MSRHHDADRRRHRSGHRHVGHDLHARALEHPADAPGVRGLPINVGFLGKGNGCLPEAAAGTDRGRRLRPEAARGLGHDAGRHRQLPGGGRRVRHPGGDPHRHAERVAASSRTRSPPSAAARSTAYHTEGAGGGHAPDIIKVARPAQRPASSTNPTRPFTVNTIDEHLDMLMVCHHLSPRIPEDVAFAESRIRARRSPPRTSCTISASSHHELRLPGHGADRRGDHPHLADRAQDEGAARAARRATAGDNDNERVKRYVAKIHHQSGHRPRHLASTSAPSSRASWPTWCSGSRRFSASSRS